MVVSPRANKQPNRTERVPAPDTLFDDADVEIVDLTGLDFQEDDCQVDSDDNDDKVELQGLLSSSSSLADEKDAKEDENRREYQYHYPHCCGGKTSQKRQPRNLPCRCGNIEAWRCLRLWVKFATALVAVAIVVWLVRILFVLLCLLLRGKPPQQAAQTTQHRQHHSSNFWAEDSFHLNPNSIRYSSSNSSSSSSAPSLEQDPEATTTTIGVPYNCPTMIDKARNDKDYIFDLYQEDTLVHADAWNKSVEELLDLPYGAWGITPRQRKGLNAQWVHWYAQALQSQPQSQSHSQNNSLTMTRKTIYESACGVGLTLFVILQLLEERYNITNLEVYGNEYILDNVMTANHFYNQQEKQHNNLLKVHKGRICHGDSTNLSFVPSNAFDVVMTGYIDPIVDPLNLKLSKQDYQEYCHNPNGTRQHQLMQQEQAIIEDWFAAWTSEMIRIAKPGGTVVVESISGPRCVVGSWGGVSPQWWTDPVTRAKYGWDDAAINASSVEFIEFDPQQQHHGVRGRYNVKMIKAQQHGL